MITFQLTQNTEVALDIFSSEIEGVYFLRQGIHRDARGWYSELARIKELNTVLKHKFVIQQVNLSCSNTNVIRGIHAENWSKLIAPVAGECLSVLADFRPTSPSFKQTLAFNLGQDSDQKLKGAIFVPPGVGNSFFVTKGPLYYLYCVDQLYKDRDTSNDLAISLFDADLSINWPIDKTQMIMSDRDQNSITLKEKFNDKKS